MKKYKYAIVCGWSTRDKKGSPSYTGGHTGLLLVSSEEPLENGTFPFELDEKNNLISKGATIEIDTYISTTITTPVKNFKHDFSNNKKTLEWCALPEKIDDNPGVNIEAIKRWWEKKFKAMQAFVFIALTNQNHLMDDGTINPEKKTEITDNLNTCDYILVKHQDSQTKEYIFSLIYKNDNKDVKVYKVKQPELESIKKISNNMWWKGDTARNSGMQRQYNHRKIIEKIAQKLPGHTPYNLSKYSRYCNNCSHLIREALTAGEIKNVKSMLSTPFGLMNDCYKLKGQYAKTLLDFLDHCINRMEEDQYKYTTPNNKIDIFREIRTSLLEKKKDDLTAKKEIEEASKLSRGFTIFSPKTYSEFQSFNARLKLHKMN